jgi:hypothetical protein
LGFAGPLNNWHRPQTVGSVPKLKKLHPLQVL